MNFNFADLFESVVDAVPDREAAICGERRLTYRELDARANRLASYWLQTGLEPGDHVGLYMYNGTEYAEAMLAACKIRAVTVNINYRYVANELKYLVEDADLVGIIYQQELGDTVAKVREECPQLAHVLYVADDSGVAPIEGAVDYDAALAKGNPARDFPARSGDDLYMVYTGGTTGMPKGVMWRQEDLFFAGLQGGRPMGDPIETPEELAEIALSGDFLMTIVIAPPFIHGTAQFAAWISFFAGGKVAVRSARSFDPAAMARLGSDEKATAMVLVGDAMCIPFVDELRANPGKYDFSELAAITSQGAILSRSTLKGLEELLPNSMILNNYGATELGHTGRALPPMGPQGKDSRIRFFMTPEIVVIDDDFNIIPPGSDKIGKLAKQGRMPIGYYKDEAKTKATFVEFGGKRWAIPGDFATVDEDGFITLLGRGSVCINSGGQKVFPEEVEEALKAHAAVEDVLVVGVKDERWGSRVEAVVQLYPGQSVAGEELKTHLRELVAGYKIPRGWHFVDKMARHDSGKPDYPWAKALAEAAQQ